jgi:hypothetical protein
MLLVVMLVDIVNFPKGQWMDGGICVCGFFTLPMLLPPFTPYTNALLIKKHQNFI